VFITTPSTRTQPFSIHSSASRREHRPSSLIRFDRRGLSATSGVAETRGDRANPSPLCMRGGAPGPAPVFVRGGVPAFGRRGGAPVGASGEASVVPACNATDGVRPCCARRAREVGGLAGRAGPLRCGSLSVERVMNAGKMRGLSATRPTLSPISRPKVPASLWLLIKLFIRIYGDKLSNSLTLKYLLWYIHS